jgi:glycerate kinase
LQKVRCRAGSLWRWIALDVLWLPFLAWGVALRVLIAPDKFKGTLTAPQAAGAIAAGWRRWRPSDTLDCLPICDGGDGFGETMGWLLRARPQRVRTVDAAHRPLTAVWWWDPTTKTAVIESARIIGLAMLPPGKFHPFQLDTFGLGAAIRAAARKGARHCLVGIGGSATNDAGFGLARALGWRFLAGDGTGIKEWTRLHRLRRILPPRRRPGFAELVVAVDVQNPLLGRRGATRVFGPQKGLREGNFAQAEGNLRRLAQVTQRQFGRRFHAAPGAGAAGGLGFGLRAFAGGRFAPGFDLFARVAGLRRRLRVADLVITGEGAMDRSTLMGKGVGEVARWCRALRVPCLGLAGVSRDRAALGKWFIAVHALRPGFVSERDALRRPARSLARLASHAAKSLNLAADKRLAGRRRRH